MTVNNSVQLDSALDALLFCIFGINGLDAGKQVAELEARSLTLFFRISTRHAKGRIGICNDRDRPRDVGRSHGVLCRRQSSCFTLGVEMPHIIPSTQSLTHRL